MTKHLFFAAVIAFAAGCTDGGKDSGGGTDTDTNGGGGGDTFDVGLTGSGVDFSTSSSASFALGLAETTCGDPDNCWYGEDCIYGDLTGNYNLCHTGMADGDSLSAVTSLDALVEGSATLFSSAIASGTTVYIEAGDGSCFISGDDVSYYSGLGCETF